MPSRPPSAQVAFILKLGAALHQHGAPAHRLEELLTHVVKGLGVDARFYATPTAIFASFGPPEALDTSFVRVKPTDIDLGVMVELDALTTALIQGKLGFQDASRRLDVLLEHPPRYGDALTLMAFAISAAAAARLFGGGINEVLVATLVGFGVGLVNQFSRSWDALSRLQEATSAFVASFVTACAAYFVEPLSVEITTVSALIVLLPGLTLTISMTELATRNLMSGTARLAGAATTLLQLTFGVALGSRVGTLLAGDTPFHLPSPPLWTLWPAVVGATFGLVILLRGRWREVWMLVVTAGAGFACTKIGGAVLGPELGAFVGALVAGATANLLARMVDKPALVSIVPALLVLVPGSLGLRSLTSMLSKDMLGGLSAAFATVIILISLVAGLLLANVLVPPRRSL